MKCYLLFLIVTLSAEIHADDLFKSNSVVTLDLEAFKTLENKPHFVKFYAPWCGHCQRLAPTWDQLAEKFQSGEKAVIAKVDCTEQPELCTQQDISGYPTIKFFKSGKIEGEKYKGSRDIEALENFLLEQIGDKKQDEQLTVEGLNILTEANFESTVASGKHFVKFYAPWCGHCKNLAPTWDKLASHFANHDKVKVGKIDCTQNGEVCKKFEVRGYPTLLWIVDGEKVEKYSGSRSLEELSSYAEKMSDTQQEEVGAEVLEEAAADGAPLLLTTGDFESTVAKGVTFVKFFAPWCGHCRHLAPTWADLAKDVAAAKIAKVDCTQEDSLCNNQDVQGYPTLVMYKDGKRVEEYNGSRDLDALKEFVQRHLKDHDEL